MRMAQNHRLLVENFDPVGVHTGDSIVSRPP